MRVCNKQLNNKMKNIKYRTMYHEYLMIKKYSRSAIKYKIAGLEGFYEQNEFAWKIVGITIEALKQFSKNYFKYKDIKKNTGMGINRSHFKVSRHNMFKKMLEMPVMSFRDWFIYYKSNDVTVLATASENLRKKEHSKIIEMNLGESADRLFKTKSYSWQHNKAEVEYLKTLYNKVTLTSL